MLMANDTQSSEAKEIARKKNLIAISSAMVVIPAGIIAFQAATLFGGFDFGIAIGVGTVIMTAGMLVFIQTQLESTISDIIVKIKPE